MSLTSAFFDAELVGGVYDRVYSAERFAEYFAAFIANGVFPDPATNLQVVANVPRDMTVLVKSGLGWINGYYCNNDGNYPLTISPASGTLPRVDAVVLRWSRSNRSISLEVKTGVATSSPSAPSLERSADNYELMLASIEVVAGATSIAQANITDKRPDSSVCGWVKGVVDQVDTTNLFAQYDAAFQEWFDNIKSQLSGDIATNLQNQIDRNTANIAVINATTLKEDTKTALGLPISAGPDDAFKVLANIGNVHVWSQTITLEQEVPAYYELNPAISGSFVIGGNSSRQYASWEYSSEISVDSAGNISLSGSIASVSGYNSSSSDLINAMNTLVGKFARWTGNGTTIGIKYNTIVFFPANASISKTKIDSDTCAVINQYQNVIGHPMIPAGTHTDFVTSTDSTAYPRDGDVGDCHYTYLGLLGGGARIEVGSYVGTGTGGSANPTVLTFGFKPKFVFIVQDTGGTTPVRGQFLPLAYGQTKSNGAWYAANSDYHPKITITWGEKSVSFYSASGNYKTEGQMNVSGRTYYTLAIG